MRDLKSQQLFGGLCLSCLTLLMILAQGTFAQPPLPSNESISGYEFDFPALGTVVSIKVFASDQELVATAMRAAQARTQELEAILTDYDPDSETSRLTKSATGTDFVAVSPDLWNVLEASDRWYQLSHGAFDASIGSLSHVWRAERRTKKRASGEQLAAALQRSGWAHVHLRPQSTAVRFDREGLRLDFGAIGKGYIVDQIFHMLQDSGLTCCLVNISGNMRCGAAPPDRSGWRIAVAPLEQHQPALRHLVLINRAIATSGDLWQYVIVDGQRRSHLFDPRTGDSVTGPISATVLAATAADADACATALCVLGLSAAADLMTSLADTEALVLEQCDATLPIRYLVTPGFAN